MNELSTEIKTHVVHVKREGVVESHFITEREKEKIWEDVRNKYPFQIDGVRAFSFFQFENLFPMSKDQADKITKPFWRRISKEVEMRGLDEIEVTAWEQIDRQTKKIIEVAAKERTIKVWTQEEFDERALLNKRIKKGMNAGKSLQQIFAEIKIEKEKKSDKIKKNDKRVATKKQTTKPKST